MSLLTLSERLYWSRYPAFLPTEAERLRLEAFFLAHPESEAVYFFSNGLVRDDKEEQRRMFSRTAQLVAIATEGFPVLVSRRRALDGPVRWVPTYGCEPDAQLGESAVQR